MIVDSRGAYLAPAGMLAASKPTPSGSRSCRQLNEPAAVQEPNSLMFAFANNAGTVDLTCACFGCASYLPRRSRHKLTNMVNKHWKSSYYPRRGITGVILVRAQTTNFLIQPDKNGSLLQMLVETVCS